MKRRDLIKQGVLCIGSMTLMPSVFSFLQSCTAKPNRWIGEVITSDISVQTDILVDFFLPRTDSIGGLDLNTTQFVDKMLANTIDTESQELFVLGGNTFKQVAENTFKKNITHCNKAEIQQLLQTYCNLLNKEQEVVFDELNSSYATLSDGKKKTYLIYNYISKVRYYSLLAYYTSQEIMENVQDINPNLGYYEGCITEYNE